MSSISIRPHLRALRKVSPRLAALMCLGGILLSACAGTQAAEVPFPWPSPTPQLSAAGADNTAKAAWPPSDEINFTNLTVQDGLSHATVETIFQDSRGFMWFGTHGGADRFDGYEFLNLHHDPQDSGSLRDDVVYAIAEDHGGFIWFGTQMGLDRFDPATGVIEHWALEAAGESAGRVIVVTSIMVDQSGDLWVGTHQGVFRIPAAQGRAQEVRHYGVLDVRGRLVEGILVASLFQDSTGEIWAGTQLGLSRYVRETDSFSRVPATARTAASPVTQPARQAEYEAELSAPFTSSPVITQAFVELKPDMLLVGGQGLTLYNTRLNSAAALKLDSTSSGTSSSQARSVWSMAADNAGTVWIGLDAGLMRLDTATLELSPVEHLAEARPGQKLILSMLQDVEGNLWLGTLDRGVYVYQPSRQKFIQPESYIQDALQQRNVWSIFEDSMDSLWIGTDQELLRVDQQTQQVRQYLLQSSPQEEVSRQPVRAIVEDAEGRIWAGTATGRIYVGDRDARAFARQFAEKIPSGYPINSLAVDRDGDIWIGTNNGLYWYQPEARALQHLVNDALDPKSLSHDRVLVVKEDSRGRLWVGTWNGLNSFDKESGRVTRFSLDSGANSDSPQDPIFAMLPERSGNLWLAGQTGGLYHLNPYDGAVEYFEDPHGSTTGLVFSVLADNHGVLWLSSQQGLTMFDPQTEVFTNYSVSDGLPVGQFSMGSSFQSRDGEMYFGGADGLLSFSPERVPRNPYMPPVVLTGLTQSGLPLQLEEPTDRVRELVIRWPNNYFEFEFAGLSYAKPEANQYAYYLEGIDPAWVSVGNGRAGRYVNLPGGRYKLHLRASNNDGLWSAESTVIAITVIPPLWQRFWFQLVLVLVAAALILAGYRYRVRSILLRSRELEHVVRERTSELSGINAELVRVVAKRHEAEQRLAQRIASEAVMAERNRLARDLHDAVTQTIFSASILSETLPHSLDSNPARGRQQIAELQRLTQGALAELRSLLVELRPEGLVKADLHDLLTQLCRGISGRSGIPADLKCELNVDIPSEIKITFYRIAQEALNNAGRHADASSIVVECCSDRDRIRLSIRDDGKGFDPSSTGSSRMGLAIMTERAADIGANLSLDSQPGRGTTVLLEWLFPGDGDADGKS